MRRFFICTLLFLNAFALMAESPSLPPPTGNDYGGSVFFRNTSSYNLYLEFDIADNPFPYGLSMQFCLEKRDAIIETFYFFVPFEDADNFNIESAYPKNYFLKIRMYDMDTGLLLTEIEPPDKDIFVLIEGSIENYTAIFTLIIDDLLLTGGTP